MSYVRTPYMVLISRWSSRVVSLVRINTSDALTKVRRGALQTPLT